ncbi:MAG: PAS domain S-box protein [Calditrichaeota bacterium]|nr:MAG: PAS domain S-box protein [Calditrichota bacterium]
MQETQVEKLNQDIKSLQEQLEKAEQKIATTEKNFEKLREKFDLVFKNTIDIFMLVSAVTGKIFDVSSSVKEHLGYESDELIGKKFVELFPPEAEAQGEVIFDKIRIFDGVFAEETFYKNDGSICFMDLSAFMGEMAGTKVIFATLRDVSERKKRIEEVEKVKKMEGALAMSGAVSHELNQPLQIIIGFSDLIIKDKIDKEKLDVYLSKIKIQSKRMSKIIGKLTNITEYKTLKYIDSFEIMDINGTEEETENQNLT